MDAATVTKLRELFPADQVGQLPRGGVKIDYVGHGAVTGRLLDVDPEWTWEPVATLDDGRPLFDTTADGEPVGLWIRLTVDGVTRLGYGSCPGNQFEAEKVLIGDAIRNAAMRFGVALDLWVKGHGEDDEQVTAGDVTGSRGRRGATRKCSVCDKPLSGDVVPHDGGFIHKTCAKASTPGAVSADNEEPF